MQKEIEKENLNLDVNQTSQKLRYSNKICEENH